MEHFSRYAYQVWVLVITFFFSINGIASVVIANTRLIYPSDQPAISIKLSNVATSPILIQSWLDSGDADSEPAKLTAPFILTPPIARIEAGKDFLLRLQYVEKILPMHQESLFWFNVLEVPTKSEKNRLQIAMRTRIKLFFRPTGLAGNANEAARAITWRMVGAKLRASNPTPYYVSFVNLVVNGKQFEGEMVAPHGALTFNFMAKAGDKISGTFINDYGITNKFDSVIQ